MLTQTSGSDSAIIVLHEIYGINRHIAGVCNQYFAGGYDVYCPDLLNLKHPFDYEQQEEAYKYFTENIGFDIAGKVDELVEQIRPKYRKVILLGFSIGATMAWLCAGGSRCDGMIGYYGSRIRDYMHIVPRCQALLIWASREKCFDPVSMAAVLKNNPHLAVNVLNGEHGFCDPFSPAFNPDSAQKAEALTEAFLLSCHSNDRG